MTTSLTSIPVAIWRDLLTIWIGDLREIVRVHFAFTISTVINPIRDAYAGRAFRYRLSYVTMHHLLKLCEWLRGSSVYMSELSLDTTRILSSDFWNDLLSWSGSHIKSLSLVISGKLINENPLWEASGHVNRLKHLRVKSYTHPHPEYFRNLLQNNANTLVSLYCDTNRPGFLYDLPWNETKCPSLQVLHCTNWDGTFLGRFLRGCPHLIALSVLHCGANAIASALSACCPLLQRLRMHGLNGFVGAELLQIARRYLELSQCETVNTASVLFAIAVTALPCLHTLLVDKLHEPGLLAIAARGHPSLRVIHCYSVCSYDGLRQITAGLPQLTKLGIKIFRIDFIAGPDSTNLFEFCSNLEVLQFATYRQSTDLANIVLESAIAHCRNLRTLIIGDDTVYNCRKLNALVDSCHQLRTVRVYNTEGVTVPPNRPGFVVTSDSVELAEWMPEQGFK